MSSPRAVNPTGKTLRRIEDAGSTHGKPAIHWARMWGTSVNVVKEFMGNYYPEINARRRELGLPEIIKEPKKSYRELSMITRQDKTIYDIVAEAKASGMSYGQYVAAHSI